MHTELRKPTHCFSAQQRKLGTSTLVISQHLSSCAAFGLTMPQPVHSSLVHVLLLWTTILSIIQITFIALFFTMGHNGLSQNSSNVEPQHGKQSQKSTTPSYPDTGLVLGKGKMVSFTAKKEPVNSFVMWTAVNPNAGVISDDGKDLTIKKDGYYFLSLRVTLCKETKDIGKWEVVVNWNEAPLLKGWINSETNSTGMLSKVTELPAGGKLAVSVTSAVQCIDVNETVTYLDLIYMDKL